MDEGARNTGVGRSAFDPIALFDSPRSLCRCCAPPCTPLSICESFDSTPGPTRVEHAIRSSLRSTNAPPKSHHPNRKPRRASNMYVTSRHAEAGESRRGSTPLSPASKFFHCSLSKVPPAPRDALGYPSPDPPTQCRVDRRIATIREWLVTRDVSPSRLIHASIVPSLRPVISINARRVKSSKFSPFTLRRLARSPRRANPV